MGFIAGCFTGWLTYWIIQRMIDRIPDYRPMEYKEQFPDMGEI